MKKCVLITGAAVNTGFGIAEKFAKENYSVFLTSRSGKEAEEAAEKISKKYNVFTKGYELESSLCEESLTKVFNDIESSGYLLDCIILNAANLGINQEIFSVSVEDFMDVINVNIGWNFLLSRLAAKQMIKKGGGSIVFINSNTSYRCIPNRASYCASKSGALGLMRALAFDLGKYNIRVNAVLPGMIKTDRWENNLGNIQKVPSAYTPIGDIADFEDIANAAYYFGSDLSKNTTGAELTVDGGNTIQLYPIIPYED